MNPYISRLLIVDDEALSATTLMQMLAKHGFTVSGAHSAGEALSLLRSESFDLLLADLMLPQINGIELLRQAQAINPHLMGIMITGHGAIDAAVDAIRSGAHDYILKPFNLTVVVPVIERALATRRLRIENESLTSSLEHRSAELEAAHRALQRSHAELDSFAHSIAHDMRTPLNAVIGFADLLLDAGAGPLNETQRGYLTHIIEGGSRLRDLTGEVLRIARLGQAPLAEPGMGAEFTVTPPK
jgi:two-component system sensor histidine kinase/response regulator